MKKIFIFLLPVLLFTACRYKSGSGNIVTEKRNTGSFTSISVGGGFEVELRHADVTELTIEADDNLIKYIHTDVSDGKLRIRLEEINVHDAHLKVFITAPEINDINASAAAAVVVKDGLKSSGSIKLQASSGANIKTGVDAPGIVADASSGGELEISGKTMTLKATSSSGSAIHAKDLLSENTTANASSGAKINVHASLSLDATASSGGNISYRGGATDVKKSASSGGDIEKE